MHWAEPVALISGCKIMGFSVSPNRKKWVYQGVIGSIGKIAGNHSVQSDGATSEPCEKHKKTPNSQATWC